MKDGEIDYSGYTPRELKEAISAINRNAYPNNYYSLKQAYDRVFPQLEPAQVDIAEPIEDDLSKLRYAGFWLRFGAMWLDAFAFLPVMAFAWYSSGISRLFYLYWFVPSILIGIWFNIYLVYRYGGTPGKLLLGIRIAMADGSHVSLKAAAIRHSVLLALTAMSSIGLIIATLRMTDSQYTDLSFLERAAVMTSLAPRWYHLVNMLSNVWFWSEFITMLFNKERRAIHDYMAGTVVIRAKAT